jgi:ribulose-5-phosphate 4-epimerase/fuculose-1-phosphate aldolase
MIQEKIPNFNFQAFYVSNETCNCPLIPEIIKVNKELKTIDLLKDEINISISMKYGKRILINAKNIDINKLNTKDFLEIVDYDPLKRVLLLMGSKEPRVETPIHWLIHHARDEVKAIIQIDNKELSEKINEKIPITEKEYQKGTLEQAKEILLLLRDSKVVVIINQGVLFVGNSMKDVKNLIIKTFEESK